jgi:hypothetical protein
MDCIVFHLVEFSDLNHEMFHLSSLKTIQSILISIQPSNFEIISRLHLIPLHQLHTKRDLKPEQFLIEPSSIPFSFVPTSFRTSPRRLHFLKLDTHPISPERRTKVDFDCQWIANPRSPRAGTLSGEEPVRSQIRSAIEGHTLRLGIPAQNHFDFNGKTNSRRYWQV